MGHLISSDAEHFRSTKRKNKFQKRLLHNSLYSKNCLKIHSNHEVTSMSYHSYCNMNILLHLNQTRLIQLLLNRETKMNR